jgi:ribosomal protein S16
MKLKPTQLVTASILILGAGLLLAQSLKPEAKKGGGIEGRLALALKMFPDADADKDGKLTLNEAFAYLEAHPDLKQKVAAGLSQAGDGSKVSSKPAEFTPGQQGTRVFVCAHSYMIYTADLLPVVAELGGLPHLKAGQQMIGGSRTLQHWQVPDERNEAKKALREGRVDVLTLSPQMLLPDEGIDLFTRLGLEKNPNLRVLVQSSWAPRDGQTGAFTNTMRDAVTAEQARDMRAMHDSGWLRQLEAQVSALNQSLSREVVRIIPVSAAVYALREKVALGQVPGVAKQSQLFRDDHGHPSSILAMLVTYCHYAAIYQRSPVGLPVPPSLKTLPEAEALNRSLQEIAWAEVTAYPFSGVSLSPAPGQ